MPNVPALILDGQLDLRTPLENGLEVAAELPRAKMVVVGGIGHDVLDSDPSDCALHALDRFVRDVPVGDPCRGTAKTNQIAPYPVAPTALEALAPPPGAHGTEGRIVTAAALTITDGYVSALQRAFAGFNRLYGGGLRSGRFVANLTGSLHLLAYSYVPGVRVSGNLDVLFGQGVGAVYVDGPGSAPVRRGRRRRRADRRALRQRADRQRRDGSPRRHAHRRRVRPPRRHRRMATARTARAWEARGRMTPCASPDPPCSPPSRRWPR
jgi:hypothetical protein